MSKCGGGADSLGAILCCISAAGGSNLVELAPMTSGMAAYKLCGSVTTCSYKSEIGPYLNEKLCRKCVLV